ncbi:MAG: hypothetical protein QXV55_00165 [Acidilobaceae archaeon]
MSETEDFVILAIKLAVLTFYLGVLVYALPVPVARLKRLAPELLVDAVYAFFLALTVFAIYDATGKIAYYLGGTWGAFDIWLSRALSLSATIKVLESLISFFPLFSKLSPLINVVVSPLSRMATLTVLLCVVLAAIATLVKSYGHILIGLGLVLYALPLKIGKDAGAWLISFVLVFSIGLPLLPVFLIQLGSEKLQQISLEPFSISRVSVTSAYGHPVSFGVLVLRNEKGDAVAIYELTENGIARSSYVSHYEIVALPVNKTLYAYLQYVGTEFGLSPWPLVVKSENKDFVLRAPHLILVAEPGVAVFSSTTLHSLEYKEGMWEVKIKAEAGDYIDVRYHRLCSVEIRHYGDVEIKKGVWRWRGVEGNAIRFVGLKSGEIRVQLSIKDCENPTFSSVSTLDYLDYVASQAVLIDWNLFKSFVLHYLTVPTLYVTTLFLTTATVTRLLGGKGKLSMRVV